MKVLVVDDDPNTVQLIEDTMPWEEYGITEILTAYHGQMAMDIIKTHQPDIVISDIEMPQMDGMQLLEQMASSLDAMPEVIFLTCHESFAFAQKAVRYGAAAYLLKPFRQEELTAVLATSVAKCRRKVEGERIREELEKNELRQKDNQDYLVRTFIRELIYRDIDGSEEEMERIIRRRGIHFDIRGNYYMVLAGINQRIQENPQLTESELHFVVKNVASEVMYDQIGAWNMVDFGRGPYYFLVMLIPEEQYTPKQLQERCERLTDAARQYLQVKLSCIISMPCHSKEIADVYGAMFERFRHEGTTRADVSWMEEERKQSSFESPVDDEKILDHLKSRKKVELVVMMKNLLTRLEQEGNLNGQMMHTIHHDLIRIFYGYLNENGIRGYKLFQDETSRLMDDRSEYSMMDMIKYVSYLYDCSVKQIEQLQQSDSLISKVKKYIDEHYSEHIGRDEIAAIVFIAPNYLSKRFRDETGQSLREYINMKRIDEAKRLMRTTHLSLTDIALQVGFDNIPYFSTVFKKYCNVSPSEWKDGSSQIQN